MNLNFTPYTLLKESEDAKNEITFIYMISYNLRILNDLRSLRRNYLKYRDPGMYLFYISSEVETKTHKDAFFLSGLNGRKNYAEYLGFQMLVRLEHAG